MRNRAASVLDEEAIPADKRQWHYSADLRYERQVHEIEVPLTEDLLRQGSSAIGAAFAARHREAYGYELTQSPIEFVNARLSAIGETPEFWFPERELDGEGAIPIGSRSILLPSAAEPAPSAVYDAARLAPGIQLSGPALIEGPRLSLLVPDDASLSVNRWGDFVLKVSR
jgi:N-methylhydantoinase A